MPISIVLDVVSCVSWHWCPEKFQERWVTGVQDQNHRTKCLLAPSERAYTTSYWWL